MKIFSMFIKLVGGKHHNDRMKIVVDKNIGLPQFLNFCGVYYVKTHKKNCKKDTIFEFFPSN